MAKINGEIYVVKTIYCKLTGKPMMIQEIRYTTGDNPQYLVNEKIIDTMLVRYLSYKHDEFKTCEVKPEEISLDPVYVNNKYQITNNK